MNYIYDIETFPNIFCLVAKSVKDKSILTFEISSRKNEINELLEFLYSKINLIGFNNINFDYPVIHWLLNNYDNYTNSESLCYAIYEEANYIINSEYSSIKKSEVIIPQLDLFKIWHFDNKAKMTSLKALEIAMRLDNVQDLPVKPNQLVDVGLFDSVIKYCINDVDATYKFYLKSINEIKLREDLSREYGLDLYNANDPKMGEEIFLDALSKEMKVKPYDLRKMRSSASKLIFKNYILDYIEFKTDSLKTLLNNLKSFVTYNTKGGFKYSAMIGDFKADYGQGGIHGCIKSGIYKPKEDEIILDIDVASYYPNLAIQNNFRPRHLGEAFSKIYKDMYIKRKSIPKSDSRNYGLKIALNGSFGKMNDENSFLYDPESLLKITLNGQLLLSMLMEDIYLNHNIKLLQANTDGFTFICKKIDIDNIKLLVTNWENITNLEMEYAEYKSMIIRDVNNYSAIYSNGKVKHKGCFEIERAWHKNHSMLIVPKALENYYINNISIEETIKSCTDILDFCKRGRSTGKNILIARNGIKDIELQKNNRYYVSNIGVDIIKIMPQLKDDDGNFKKDKINNYRKNNPQQMDLFHFVEDVIIDKPRETNIEAGYKCTLYNTIDNKDHLTNINYRYYINECYKIINVVGKIK